MYPAQVNTPRLYAMIFGFFSLTAIYVVAQASLSLNHDAEKTVYMAQAAEATVPIVDPTINPISGVSNDSSEVRPTPTLAPLPVLTSPLLNSRDNQSDNQFNNQPENKVMATPAREGFQDQSDNQFNNKKNNFKSTDNFNAGPESVNESNDTMGENEEQDQEPQFDAAGIKNGVQAARSGFNKFVGEFKNVGPFIIKFKAAKRVAGTVKPKQAAEKLCPLVNDLLVQAKDLQNKLAVASVDVAEGYSSMATALDVATHVLALEAVVLEDSGDTVTIDTGEEEATAVNGCQAAQDLRGTIKMMNSALPQMTKFTAQAVREINNNKKILFTLEKKADQLDQMKDPSVMFRLFGQAEQSAQKVLMMANDFLSRIVNSLEQMN